MAHARAFSSETTAESTPTAEQTEVASVVESAPMTSEGTLIPEGMPAKVAAHLFPSRKTHPRFLPRLSRAEKGSYASEAMEEAFFDEAETLYARLPDNKALYNLQDLVPELNEPRSALVDVIRAARERAGPKETLLDTLVDLNLVTRAQTEPRSIPESKLILEWETRFTFVTGHAEEHPADWVAKCRVHLRDLQREARLSDEGLEHIARVAGPRYCPKTGVLTLTCREAPNAELNRQRIMRWLRYLTVDARRKYPLEGQSAEGEEAEQERDEQERDEQEAELDS
ncbi:hypothetical protein H632_c2620p0, partial [Helicosporidium sp. ATCC 50920]